MNRCPGLVRPALLALLSLGASIAPPALAGTPFAPAAISAADLTDTTDRLIVRLRDRLVAAPGLEVGRLGGRFGEALKHRRTMADGSLVVDLPRRMRRNEAAAVARRLASDMAVAYAEPDVRVKPMLVPNDSRYGDQWHYHEPAGGINLPAAWDITTGSSALTVAVLDTGVRPHPDLAPRLANGYDFIADVPTANDGDGRDPDAHDPGDFGCNGSTSSWHGTHVAGTIGAATNNGAGVAGVNWVSKIQSIRVLGRCGGYISDIADGMRWAAGIAVPGVPANATPSRVLNLSLGGSGACPTTFQNAVNDVTARGAVVVVAAGNSGVDASLSTPANCSGVIAVAATTRTGGRASYSNFGPVVSIAAPGGGGGQGVLSTLNAGSTTPGGDNYAYYQGTSMAAPHVAGVVSLMLSATPSLTPAQVLNMLRSTARPFPTGTGSDCTTALCGAGIVDAAAAVRAGAPPPPPPATDRVNLALAANGAVATASSTLGSGYPPSSVINGDRTGRNWGTGGGWIDATGNVWGDWLQVDFPGVRTVAQIDVFSIQDNWQNPVDPTRAMRFSQYGIVDFEVQYWTGSTWQTVPGGSVTGNNLVWRTFTFTPVSTSRIRVLIARAPDASSRLAEVEAYSTAETAPTAVNVAHQANGGVAMASSVLSSGYSAASVVNGDRRGINWNLDGGWHDGTPRTFPDTMQVNFNGTKQITGIDVFMVQDNWSAPQEPTETMIFNHYGLIDFDVQYWNGSAWLTVPGGNVTGNNKVWRRFAFPSIATNSIRVVIYRTPDGSSRLTEIEAYSAP